MIRFPHRLGTGSPGGAAPADLGSGRAHAKTILIGEHAVVYGAPAIAVPVTALETTATLRPSDRARIDSALHSGRLEAVPPSLAPVVTAWRAATEHFGLDQEGTELLIGSALPPGRGLGSSAAVAAAIVRAVADSARAPLPSRLEHDLIQQAERVAHGSPSGLDARAVVAEGPIRFDRGEVRVLPVAEPFALVIADTGADGATASAVAAVRELREGHPRTVDATVEALARLAEEAASDLAHGDGEALGSRLRHAHELLGLLGVSSPALDALVRAAHAAGSLGAKLTGAGRGGCVVALAPSVSGAGDLARALETAGAVRTWTTVVEASA